MTEGNFNVGERIVITDPQGDPPLAIGMTGTIVCVDCGGAVYGVDFDDSDYDFFHHCYGLARDAHGWFVITDQISHVDGPACNIELSAADLSKLF